MDECDSARCLVRAPHFLSAVRASSRRNVRWSRLGNRFLRHISLARLTVLQTPLRARLRPRSARQLLQNRAGVRNVHRRTWGANARVPGRAVWFARLRRSSRRGMEHGQGGIRGRARTGRGRPGGLSWTGRADPPRSSASSASSAFHCLITVTDEGTRDVGRGPTIIRPTRPPAAPSRPTSASREILRVPGLAGVAGS